MVVRLSWARAAGVLAFLAAAPTLADDRYALLIGLNRYQAEGTSVAPLEFAENDVKELEKAMLGVGYREVVRLLGSNARRREILKELHRFAVVMKPEDTFVLYFAGHGVRGDNRATYWLTYDAELGLLDDGGIRLEHLMDYVRDIPAGRKMVILDHCFSGDVVLVDQGFRDAATTTGLDGTTPSPVSRAGSGKLVLNPRGVSLIGDVRSVSERAGGVIVLAASRGPAFEIQDKRHGAYTLALLEALTSRRASRGAKDLKATQLIEYLRDRVSELTSQQPEAIVNAQNVDQWIIAADLQPDPTDLSEVEAQITRWHDKLDDWLTVRKWINLPTKIQARAVFARWREAVKSGKQLGEADHRKLGVIRQHLEVRSGTSEQEEEQYAKDLEEVLGKATR